MSLQHILTMYELSFIPVCNFLYHIIIMHLDKEVFFSGNFPNFSVISPYFPLFSPFSVKVRQNFLTKEITINVYTRLAKFDQIKHCRVLIVPGFGLL